jgi:hypothetical protein
MVGGCHAAALYSRRTCSALSRDIGLLREPGGGDGRGAVEEKLLVDHPSSRECDEKTPLGVERGSASEAAALLAPDHQYAAVPEVGEFFGLEPEIGQISGPPPLGADARFATAIHGIEANLDELRSKDRFRIPVEQREGHLEVSAVGGLKAQPDGASDDRPSQPRPWRQPEDRSVHKRNGAREAQAQMVFQAAARLCFDRYRLAHYLPVLLRHHPSIPRTHHGVGLRSLVLLDQLSRVEPAADPCFRSQNSLHKLRLAPRGLRV